jgi:EmrB/QacA subfamily drug resistance transporter
MSPAPVGAIALYLIAMAVNGLDGTIVGPALPSLAHDLGVTVAAVSAVETVFLVASAVALPAGGWVGERFGPRRVVSVGLFVFALASAGAAAADSLMWLCVARAVQGAASGLLTPVGLAMVYRGAGSADRLRIARLTTVPLTIAPMLGPVLGGALTEHLGWRAVFLVTVPLGIAAAAYGWPGRVHRQAEASVTGLRPLDVRGLVLAGSGLGAVMTGLSLGLHTGWGRPAPLVTGAVGAALLVAAVRAARTAPAPVLDLALWQDRLFRHAGAAVAWSSAGLMALLYLMPLVLQEVGGLSPAAAGLAMVPEMIGLLIGSQVVGRASRRAGPRALALLGLAGAAAVTTVLLVTAGRGGVPLTGGLLLIFGLCLSQTVLLGQAAAFATVTERATTDATALFMAQRTTAGALGVVVAAAALGIAQGVLPDEAAYRVALATVVALFALAAVPVLRLGSGELAKAFAPSNATSPPARSARQQA